MVAAQRERGRPATPLDVLARDFELSPLAVSILFAIVAPRLRGELARLYGILANDPGRPLVDEYLLGSDPRRRARAPTIARELDGDRPLRRYGLVRVGAGRASVRRADRRSAGRALHREPVRRRRARPAPRRCATSTAISTSCRCRAALIRKALRYPVDAARRRAGRGSSCAVAPARGATRCSPSLAARAGRALGVIDLDDRAARAGAAGRGARGRAAPRDVARPRAVRRRARADRRRRSRHQDPDRGRAAPPPRTARAAAADRRRRSRSIRATSCSTSRSATSASAASRGRSRSIAIGSSCPIRASSRRATASDRASSSASAPRSCGGPTTADRCGVVGARARRRRAPAPREPARQDRDARHPARDWADIVLPEDIVDSLLELTARVRHRKKVFEQWGFDRSITTARGITALFSGSPGTGKTMVAGVIARDLGLELYRVDVSRITSKWIGETEKNLGSAVRRRRGRPGHAAVRRGRLAVRQAHRGQDLASIATRTWRSTTSCSGSTASRASRSSRPTSATRSIRRSSAASPTASRSRSPTRRCASSCGGR